MLRSDLVTLLMRDSARWNALGHVDALQIPHGCIGAGFVRNLVWDHLHGRLSNCHDEDIDVLWHDPLRAEPYYDRLLEEELRAREPGLKWSVKNQARMHLRNGDDPYASIEAAMQSWPETATAVAVKRSIEECEIIAPFDLDDLFNMTLRPTSSRTGKLKAFEARVHEKQWLSRWPQLILAS